MFTVPKYALSKTELWKDVTELYIYLTIHVALVGNYIVDIVDPAMVRQSARGRAIGFTVPYSILQDADLLPSHSPQERTHSIAQVTFTSQSITNVWVPSICSRDRHRRACLSLTRPAARPGTGPIVSRNWE
jgi:hypothetical protein